MAVRSKRAATPALSVLHDDCVVTNKGKGAARKHISTTPAKEYASNIHDVGGITFRINPQNVLLGGTRNYGSEFFSNTFFSGDTVIGLLHTGKESVRKPEIPT